MGPGAWSHKTEAHREEKLGGDPRKLLWDRLMSTEQSSNQSRGFISRSMQTTIIVSSLIVSGDDKRCRETVYRADGSLSSHDLR
jgi:hypothetical protein